MDSNNDSTLMACEPGSSWGGQWTEEKLDAFEKYVKAYLTIMNANRDKYNWKLVYVDGFAGSGSRNGSSTETSSELLLDLFENEYLEESEINTYKGAAERVLSIDMRGFDFYFFIDKDEASSNLLSQRLEPLIKGKIVEFRSNDANTEVKKLASAMKNNPKLRALVLLDPFGMQVNWATIAALEKTKTDLWILVPTGVIVNRLLVRKGEPLHIERLTSFFGKNEEFLKQYFYSRVQEQTLFGEVERIEKVKKPIQKIAELYIQQLQGIFKFVTSEPLVLYNSRNTPIFHFVCASNNETAIKIASQIIKKKK